MLCLHLFGSLGASWRTPGGAIEPIALTARPGSLLAFLALSRGQFFARGELIATLWGEGHESSTLGSFNTTLWRLRKAVERAPLHPGDLIACDHRGAVGMPRAAPCTLDVEGFEQLVAAPLARAIEQLDPADINALRDGVARYTDDILAGFSDEWAMREREKLRRHYLNSLGRLMQLCTLARDYTGAIGYAQQILDRDILREDIHCELMRLFLRNGQRALALRQFERCRDALRRELAIQPMRETMALYQQIAERAVRQEDMGLPAGPAVAQPRHAAAAMQPSVASIQPAMGAVELIDAARRHLALADEQLQHTLPLVTPPSQARRPM
jgi:DNA-binding SARP family transcriptional activator